MTSWITSLIQHGSYAGVLFLMILENVFPPIPSELIMPLAGFVSAQGQLSLVGVILAGTAGSVLGALPLYYLGRRVGERRLHAWAERHGRWLGLSGADLEKAAGWFARHGAKTVLLCRVIPGIRSLISIPAGFARMPLPRFLIYTTIGSAVWTAALAIAGVKLGQNYRQVEHYVGPISAGVLSIIAAAFILRIVRQEIARRRRAG